MGFSLARRFLQELPVNPADGLNLPLQAVGKIQFDIFFLSTILGV
jgi:hypothetical protein